MKPNKQIFRNFSLLPALAALLLAGCTWVQLTAEGEGVTLVDASAVSSCQRLGRATAQTMSRVTVVERGAERMQEELLVLARNEAGRMGGNRIVPESVITEGSQIFGVYNCR